MYNGGISPGFGEERLGLKLDSPTSNLCDLKLVNLFSFPFCKMRGGWVRLFLSSKLLSSSKSYEKHFWLQRYQEISWVLTYLLRVASHPSTETGRRPPARLPSSLLVLVSASVSPPLPQIFVLVGPVGMVIKGSSACNCTWLFYGLAANTDLAPE